jgi:multiple sugar transport system permease protein
MNLSKRSETVAGYVFLLPWIVGFTVFLLLPMFGAVALSLFKWNGIATMKFRGLKNYSKAFGDKDFWQSLKVTAVFVFSALPIRMVVALCLALLVRSLTRFKKAFSAIIYVPAIIPGVAMAMLFTRILNPTAGLINRALSVVGIQGPQWLFSEDWALPGLILMFIWQSGAAMILYLVGLETIPKALLESAAIDGANARRRFFHIVLPLLTPIILYNLIVGIIGNFQYFAPVFVMTGGGPNNATLFYVFNVYRTAFQYFELGYGAALSVILFALIGGLTVLAFRSSRSWVFYSGGQ